MFEISFVIVIFIVGFCFTFIALMLMWRDHFIHQHAIKIYGRVVALSDENVKNTQKYTQPIIEYQFQGQRRRFQLPIDSARAKMKIQQDIEIYVFREYLDTAMTVESIQRAKGISYALAIIGLVVIAISLGIGAVYFQDGIELSIDFNDPSHYGDLFFSIMMFIAVKQGLSHLLPLFKASFAKVPLEKNSHIVVESDLNQSTNEFF